MLKYKSEIEKLNYYAWAKFLEGINEEKALYKILDKLEVSIPERSLLRIFRQVLYKEFEQCNCFYCGKKMNEGIIHVDHFIPWSFIKEDKLWNFVLSCQKCNKSKKNKLAPASFVEKICVRNRSLLHFNTDFVQHQFKNYSDDLIPSLWKYAKYGGLKVLREKSVEYKIEPERYLKVASPE